VIGSFSFAASGAFAAMEKKLDPFGVLVIAFVTAVGGGTIRDILIGNTPVTWLTNTRSIFIILIGAAVAMFFASYLRKFDKMLFLFDAIGLGLFTMIGIQKGMEKELTPGICIALGTITACFGGVLRDVLLNNVPFIFRKEIYASACIIGGLLFFVLLFAGLGEQLAFVISMLCVFLTRITAARFNWSLPRFYERRNKADQ
jgi:uncharacterized membrane protein YeiH